MLKKKILVTGSNGQLGSEIKELAKDYNAFDFLFTDRQQLSISDQSGIDKYFDDYQPDFCINCAAYTAVDKAEDLDQRSLVNAINSDAVSYLAKACAKHNSKLIHISTDYVFEGNGTAPYKEYDKTEPVSIYGITKLQGEENALKYTDAVIVRTAWVYSSFGKNFVKTMMKLMREKQQINVVSDQYGTPTYAADLADAIMKIIVFEKWHPGIYHYTNEGKTNWYEFALAIKELINANCDVKAIPTIEYPTPAKRPAWSVLDKSKVKEVYNINIPEWKESLVRCIRKT